MNIYYKAFTNSKHLVLRSLVFKKGNKEVKLRWDRTEFSGDGKGFCEGSMYGIKSKNKYMDGKLDELDNMEIVSVITDSPNCDIYSLDIVITDDNEILSFINIRDFELRRH